MNHALVLGGFHEETMTQKDELIEKILDRELAMFLSVPVKTPSSCQKDTESFRLMRSAQFSVWSVDTLVCYHQGLSAAEKEGRNLMTLKYARMDNLIPTLHNNPDIERLIDRIVSVQLSWQKGMAAKYPFLIGLGRPLGDTASDGGTTSFTTYLRSEMETYSEDTLLSLSRDVNRYQEKGENMTEKIYLNMVQKLGYSSLEDAESAARQQHP